MKLNHQELMNKAYANWKTNEKMNSQEFFESLSELEKTAVALGNLNYQVGNGGFMQWEENGYKANHLSFLKCLELTIKFSEYPQLVAALNLIKLATGRRTQDICDTIFYSLNNLEKEMNDYLLSLQK
jgi:hypothetical protein